MSNFKYEHCNLMTLTRLSYWSACFGMFMEFSLKKVMLTSWTLENECAHHTLKKFHFYCQRDSMFIFKAVSMSFKVLSASGVGG